MGVEDEVYGQRVGAIVTRKPAAKGREEDTEKSINDFLRDRLAAYKRPRKLVIVPEIPRNHMGKVNKKTLLKELGLEGVL